MAKGTAGLYTREYFEAVKAHLNPGGFFTLYVPLYETDVATVRSELATFFSVFPEGAAWANTRDGQGYDMVLLGQAEPLRINVDALQTRLDRPEYAPVAESLRAVGIDSAVRLLSSYAGSKSDLDPWLLRAEINTDRNLRLMYLAGWGVNTQQADVIYRDILKYRSPPDRVFQGSPEALRQLLSRIGGGN